MIILIIAALIATVLGLIILLIDCVKHKYWDIGILTVTALIVVLFVLVGLMNFPVS